MRLRIELGAGDRVLPAGSDGDLARRTAGQLVLLFNFFDELRRLGPFAEDARRLQDLSPSTDAEGRSFRTGRV
jgi:hypothetical protein